MQAVCLPLCFALFKVGNNNAARIAMIAITTRSSTNVNAFTNFLPGTHLNC